jgi:hypothetical protein
MTVTIVKGVTADDVLNGGQIAANSVTYGKIQQESANTVLGNPTGSTANVQEIATTGSGNVVRATSPTLVSPALGTPTVVILTNATGTAAGLTAGNVTTNANLTGPITSVGNATSIASQTGMGTKFVVDTSPTLVTPNLGTPTAVVLTNATGTASGLTAGAVTTNANLTGPITSIGNATSVASQTGTGSTFVMDTSPTLVTPALGAATATSLNASGAIISSTSKDDYIKIVGVREVVLYGTGTWTITRLAQANYVARHSAALDVSIIGIDISEPIRLASSKGFKLNSIDVLYNISTLALNAHSATLDLVNYVDSSTTTITSLPLTGSLSIGPTTNNAVTNLIITSPSFDVTDDSKYVFELTVDAGITSAYDYLGLVLRFSRNDL